MAQPSKKVQPSKVALKDYDALGRRSIVRVSDLPPKHRMLIFARPKKGKSRFGLSSGERTLVIDPGEFSTAQFHGPNPELWRVSRWEDLDEVFQFLLRSKEAKSYVWVSVDGLTKINNFALRFVMKLAEQRDLTRQPGIVDRRFYNKSGELMKGLIANFHSLPQSIVFTAQEKRVKGPENEREEEEEGRSEIAVTADLPDSPRGAVLQIVDVVGRLYVKKVTVRQGKKTKEVAQRRLWIGPSEFMETGYRSDFVLPDFVRKPTIPKLIRLVTEGE